MKTFAILGGLTLALAGIGCSDDPETGLTGGDTDVVPPEQSTYPLCLLRDYGTSVPPVNELNGRVAAPFSLSVIPFGDQAVGDLNYDRSQDGVILLEAIERKSGWWTPGETTWWATRPSGDPDPLHTLTQINGLWTLSARLMRSSAPNGTPDNDGYEVTWTLTLPPAGSAIGHAKVTSQDACPMGSECPNLMDLETLFIVAKPDSGPTTQCEPFGCLGVISPALTEAEKEACLDGQNTGETGDTDAWQEDAPRD